MTFTILHAARPRRLALLVIAAALLVACLPAARADATPSSPRSAVVTMGDSYISGEAGRWQGNSVNSAGDRDGTDRACVGTSPACTYDRRKVYGNTTRGGTAPTGGDGCHRSDVAEVLSARFAVDERINISCSGGVTKNIFRAQSGGEGQNGEAPQADQLLPIAREKNVKMIVVSIGGNDLGFAGIVRDCFTRYMAFRRNVDDRQPCEPDQQRMLDERSPRVIEDVKKAIDEIRAAMSLAGYATRDYRLVFQTYPSVIPRASESRYVEGSPERDTFGCPFFDQDLTWGRTKAAPQIGGVVKAAADARGVEVLELIDAFQGREICSKSSREVSPSMPPSPMTSEWGRALSAIAIEQGDTQEVFHPNAFGQQALGTCLTQVFTEDRGSFRCTNTPGRGTDAMVLARTAGAPVPSGPGTEGRQDGGGGTGLAPAECAGASPADRATARRRGRGLRFALPANAGRFTVDVFQQSSGRRVLGNRLVARFRGRSRSFTWNGRANRRGRRVADGMYVVRFRTGSDEGRRATQRVRGRFRARPDYSRSPGCGMVRLFKLERPVFGGRGNRAIDVSYKLDREAAVEVTVLRGGRTLRTFRTRTAPAGRVVRLRLPAERVGRGDVRVVLRASAGGTTVQRTLVARRL